MFGNSWSVLFVKTKWYQRFPGLSDSLTSNNEETQFLEKLYLRTRLEACFCSFLYRKPDVVVATIQTRATRGKDSKTLSDLQRMKIISRYYFAVHPTLSHLLQKNWYNFKIKSKRELCKFISNMNHAGKKLDKLISKTYLENCSNTSAFL